MSSQWTIPKLVTWRVKDWASCFLACKIPLEVDEDGVNNNNGNITNNNNLTVKKTKRKMKSKKKRLSLSPPVTRHHHLHLRGSSVSPTLAARHRRLSWPQPPVSDEGFIVFCFDREDGGFDVVKEGQQEKNDMESLSEKSRTVNRKLIYGDQGVGGTENNNTLEISGTESDEKDNTFQESKDVSCDVHEVKKNQEEEEIDASEKSSGSNNSDERRGSFAFPILGAEWMGSPVQMPKSDELSPKKQKPIALGFQCCRF